MNHAIAECGGHVTLLFSIHSEDPDPLRQGSRGAGINLTDGVECRIETSTDSDGFGISIGVRYLGEEIDDEEAAFLYIDLIEEFMQKGLLDETLFYSIDVELGLPVSQGFGMSAAGLLACSRALCEILQLDIDPAIPAHVVERRNSSGLGDVLAATVGGVELRTHPGSPPSPGRAVSFAVDAEVVLCWDNTGEKHTGAYIDDPEWIERISVAGEAAADRLSKHPWGPERWDELIEESRRFADESGMLGEDERQTLLNHVESLIPIGCKALLCMLGTSVCIVPTDPEAGLPELDEGSWGLDTFRTTISSVIPLQR